MFVCGNEVGTRKEGQSQFAERNRFAICYSSLSISTSFGGEKEINCWRGSLRSQKNLNQLKVVARVTFTTRSDHSLRRLDVASLTKHDPLDGGEVGVDF